MNLIFYFNLHNIWIPPNRYPFLLKGGKGEAIENPAYPAAAICARLFFWLLLCSYSSISIESITWIDFVETSFKSFAMLRFEFTGRLSYQYFVAPATRAILFKSPMPNLTQPCTWGRKFQTEFVRLKFYWAFSTKYKNVLPAKMSRCKKRNLCSTIALVSSMHKLCVFVFLSVCIFSDASSHRDMGMKSTNMSWFIWPRVSNKRAEEHAASWVRTYITFEMCTTNSCAEPRTTFKSMCM